MIFVFYVNRGTFINFDDRILHESVGCLKQAIHRKESIPIKSQVILVSGGYEPADRALVSECNAGLEDNNPIYLFRRVETESQPNETVPFLLIDVTQLQERVTSQMTVNPSYMVIRQRVQLAKDFSEHSVLQVDLIRRLVKEQHMMSQGWYVALANLDEKCDRLKKRYAEFLKTWEQYMEDRAECQDLVDNFEEVLEMLERIRLPDSLVASCCDVAHMSVSSITVSQVAALKDFQREREEKAARVSLLDWLNSFDKRGSLTQVLSKVRSTLERLNESVAVKIAAELPDSLGLANEHSQEHRVVSGLEQRLSQMSHNQSKAEGRCRTQQELTATLASNLERLDKERDASVVGELCRQHKRYVMQLGDNHKRQTEAVQFALNGKNDFMHNLHFRFLWLTRIEMRLGSHESYFKAVYSRLHELSVHRKVLAQAKVASRLYAETLTELVRRREFAEAFADWSGGVVDLSTEICQQEVTQREHAVQRLDDHFLWCLFRSIKRMPAKFASKRPVCVDADLPALTRADLQQLRDQVPELAEQLTLASSGLAHAARLVTPQCKTAVLDGSSQTEEPPCLEARPVTDDEEVFSSALLHLEPSRHSESVQTDTEEWRSAVVDQLLQLQSDAVPGLRDSLAAVQQRLNTETEAAQRDADALRAGICQLQEAWQREVDRERELAEQRGQEEREALTRRAEEAEASLAAVRGELAAERAAVERRLAAQEAQLAAVWRGELDRAHKAALLEHEVALEGERGRHAAELAERTAELREAERQVEWRSERLASAAKERELLERAAAAEKRLYEAEVARWRDEAECRGGGRRGRRVGVSGDEAVSLRRFSVATVNTDSADEAELLEVEEVPGWAAEKEAVKEELQERIAELEAQVQQRDSHIADLQRTVDRLSQQAIRDREYIRQLRSTSEVSTRSVLGSSPQPIAGPRSPPVLEQPGPISTSFMMMASPTGTETAPVTCPPRSVLGTPVTASSSMTESAISSVSACTPPKPPSPRTPEMAMATSTTSSTSPLSSVSQRSLKIVLSQFRSGDRVLLLRNPGTGLWFMLSTDGWSYFVHSDCFVTLELDNERFYTVAEFKSKERCLARKDRNRFALPAGNYFFRIKARPLRDAPGQAWPGQTPIAGQVTDPTRQERLATADE